MIHKLSKYILKYEYKTTQNSFSSIILQKVLIACLVEIIFKNNYILVSNLVFKDIF